MMRLLIAYIPPAIRVHLVTLAHDANICNGSSAPIYLTDHTDDRKTVGDMAEDRCYDINFYNTKMNFHCFDTSTVI